MSSHQITVLILITMFVFTSLGIYLFYKWEVLFNSWPVSRFFRKIITVSVICLCFYMALMPFYPCYNAFNSMQGYFTSLSLHAFRATFFVFLPVVVLLNIQRILEIRNVPVIKQHIIIIGAIFLCLTSTNLWMRLLINEPDPTNTIIWTFLLSLFFSGIVSVLYLTINYTQLAQKRLKYEKELEISRLNELKTKAELEALQAKINPHFLYNTLNSIAELSIAQGTKARNMTVALADIFRYSLNKTNEAEISIAEEVDMVENYLTIEKIRFEDRLDITIRVDDTVKYLHIPKFILQPLVENATKHGLKDPAKKGIIEIVISGTSKAIAINVRDNGLPFPVDMQIGYGLKNVMDKLNAFYTGNNSINFENYPVKQVSINITTK